MKKLSSFALFVLLLTTACGKKQGNDRPGPTPPADGTPVSFEGNLLAVTNESSSRIEVYDPVDEDWNDPKAVRWSWKPELALGFSPEEVSLFGGGTDVKLREVPAWERQKFVAITDNSTAAIVEYPSGKRKWSMVIKANLHSGELLPDGNIAIAASDGGWVRVYASSQGSDARNYAEYPLLSAHAVLWDPTEKVLWVTGQDPVLKTHILTALTVGGTSAQPALNEKMEWRTSLPTAWGHEISAYIGDPDLLWVTSNGGEYVFNKKLKQFSIAPTGGLTFVKGLGNQPSGQLFLTRPDVNKSPRPENGCSLNDWSTCEVEFYSNNGSLQGKRTINSTCFYRVKYFTSTY